MLSQGTGLLQGLKAAFEKHSAEIAVEIGDLKAFSHS